LESRQNPVAAAAAPKDARAWTQILAGYRQPSTARSIVEIVITVVPLATLWVLAWATLDIGYWLSLPLAVAAAGFLVRLFAIQHDCSHGAFFRHRLANDWFGRIAGVLTFTPYGVWRQAHATHHASTGNLDRRGLGDVETLTVGEYRACSFWGRLRYRLYRHPLVMFGLGPAYLFILQHRLPVGLMGGWRPWASSMTTNLAIVSIIQGIPAGAPAGPAARRFGRGLDVLCPASVRADDLGERPGVEPARRGPERQLALRPAGVPALVHRQYRRASRASPQQPHPLLPPAARTA
jgi:omega-6 fatty acid desaturase (delta-12 desaturase)